VNAVKRSEWRHNARADVVSVGSTSEFPQRRAIHDDARPSSVVLPSCRIELTTKGFWCIRIV
jgi:hypothetical protein